MMTEYINKDFYKQIPPKERHYLNVSSEAAKLFMERLKAANIQFSATLSEYKNTVTVFKADSERANAILRSVSEEKTRQSRKIIGNTDYRFISDKKYINTDAQTALQIATILSGDSSNRFSGIIDGNKATITVSGEKNAASVRRMVDNIRHMDLINELNSAGFERIADSNGFVNIRNNATGVVTGFDGMETVKVMFNDPDNEFFHPAAYRIELTSDAFGDPYYISEYDMSSGDEKSSYHNSMGDTPTFVTVNEAVEYARSNNISITNSAEQLNEWKNIDDERERNSIAKENAQLILQFPMKDGSYPDYIRYNEQKECFDWFYFNPDGDDGKGEFEVRTVYMQDIYAAYAARSTAGSKAEGRNAFLSYLYSNCENEIVDTYSGYFANYAQDSITPPENMSVYYGIAENSNATAIDDFIMLLAEKASIAIIDDKAEKEHIMQEKSEHKEDSPVGNLVSGEDIALSEQLIKLTNEITKKQAEFTGFIGEGNYDMASSAAAELAEMSKRAEEIKAHIKYSELDKAKKYISDFLESEYKTVPSDDDFKDLQHILIGYTTLGDNEEYQLQLEADLIDYEIRYMIDGKTVMTDNYDSLEEMNENALSVLDFDELVGAANDYIEQNMEQETSDRISEKNFKAVENIEVGDEITLHGDTFVVSSINGNFMMSMDKKEPNSSGMDTISRQFIGNWRNRLVDETGNEPIIVVKAHEYVNEQLAAPKEEPEQAQRSYADFGITQADIDVLRTLPPRKSILNFTDEEKTATEKWAARFENDIAEKSPYFRAENGDWRAEDNTRIPVIELEKKDISFAQIKEEVKSGIIERGNVINSDTKWNITISRKGLEDTIRYADKHNDNVPYNLLEKVKYILENSVLLDSQISDDNKNNKANSTGIMHKLYAAVKIGNEPYIAKSTVEEFFNGNIKNPDTLKRLYNLQDIKIEPLKTISFTGNRLHSAIFNGTDISISDLFEVVKSCDKDFYTNSPDHALVHKGKSQGTYEIYQIPSGERYRDIRFESMEHLSIMGQLPDRLNYEKVYSGRLDDIEYDDKPEGIFVKFNMNRPEDFEGHSLSVSDVIVIEDENGKSAHFVDDVGFKDITEIFLEHERKEQTVEQLNINDYENIRLVSRSEWDDYTLGDDENPAFEEISVSYTPDEDGSFTKYAHNTTNSSLVDVWDEESSVSADDLLEDISNHLKKMGQDKSNRSYHIELADYDGNSRKLDSNNFSFVMEDKQREQSEMAAPDVELEKSVEEGIIGSMGYPIDEMDKAFEAENSRADYDNEAEPARKKSGSEVEVGDVFLYNDREYTVTSEKGIYPDDVGVSYEDKAGNTSYLTTQNVNRYKLAENGIFLGNPEKEKQKEKSQEMFERWGEQYSELTNSLDFDIIIHQSRNIVNAKKEIFEKSDVEEKNSPMGNTEKSFSEQVDEALNGTLPFYTNLKVCDTPQILLDVGCEQLPMLYTQKHLKDALKSDSQNQHLHNLDIEQIKKLPELIVNPVMVYDSLSRNDSIVIVTSENDKNNNPIIVSVKPNGEGRYELETIQSNFITSVHGRENFKNQLLNAYNSDKILFCNKNKSQEMFERWGLQLSELTNSLDFDIIIHKSRNIVNTQNEKSSQKTVTEQHKENSPVGNKRDANSYEPKIGDLIEYQDTLFRISDVSSSYVTLQTADTLIPQTSVVSLTDLITSESLNVIEENGEPVPARTAPVKESETEQPSEEKPKAQNFVIADENFGVAGGAKTRYADNVEAIKTLKAIEAENRTATPEEQKILSKYTGWGAIPQAFDVGNDKWRTEYAELRTLLTPDEYAAARKSTMNAHYTSPTVISAIYDGLKNIGFEQGKILEPAVGIGNFFGAMPEEMRNSKLYGVELDSLTGRIAQQLYPEADIQIKGFEETAFADNSFDVAIGNVPFGEYKLNDRRYNDNNFLIHDYFFAKALDKVHPGGVVAFVTSKGTLDKENSEVRKYIAQRAELLGAIRLPNNAFKANAGTEVTSDIIFLQKRERPIEINPDEVEWLKKAETPDGFSVNNYFVQHPEMVLGKIVEGNKMYGNAGKDTSCIPIEGADLKQQLAEAIKNISGKYRAAEREIAPQNVDEVPAPANSRKYSFYAVDGNLYYREAEDTMKKVNVSKDTLNRAVGLIELRDNVRELLDLQLNNSDGTLDGDIVESRKKLNIAYDSFVAKYGNVSDRKNAKAMQGDDGYNIVSALEVKDEKGQVTGKADIFTHNTVKPKIIASHVDTAEEALILSVAEKAKVDFDYMTALCGMDKDRLISELSGQIFRLPQEEEKYVTADEYLTGNIRKKLRELENAPDDMDVSENRKALEAAMPPRVEAKDISVKLGAHWVDPMYIQQFICETFNPEWRTRTDINVQYSSVAGTWKIEGVSPNAKNNYAATHTYGTKRKNAYEIIEGILNNGDLQVKDRVKDEYGHDLRDANGRYVLVVNAEETKAVQHCANVIKSEFQDWIFKDPDRRETLVQKYNEVYNSIRHREYDGSHLNFVGMNTDITLKEHQKNAVARGLYGGNSLLAHAVGAGKTFEMIAIAMEGKRLGLHNKCLFAVPNALTEQMGNDFRKLYPNANILVATQKDFERQNRLQLLGRIAANDWDAVIVGHSQFDRMGLSPEKEKMYLTAEVEKLREELEKAADENGGKKSFTVKQIEKSIANYEDKLEKLNDAQVKDGFIDFEQLGFDKVFVDESHMYKNLATATKMHNVSGLGTQGSARAFNLLMKSKYLDELTGGRGLTFASGTPVSNSMTELYTLMRYLQADTLKELGINHFDEWAADFGEIKTDYELKPESDGKYQLKTRFAKFTNLPELMGIFKEAADIRTADTLDLEKPKAVVTEVVAKPSKIQKKAIKSLGKRAAKIRNGNVDPRDDNMLKITSDGRKIGLDQRLLNSALPDDPDSKVNLCVRNVLDIYNQTADKRSTQCIFCDLSTPKSETRQDRFAIYRSDSSKELGYDIIRKKTGIKKDMDFSEIKKYVDKNSSEEEDKLKNGDIAVIRRPSEDMTKIISEAAVFENGKFNPVRSEELLEKLAMSPVEDMPPKEFNVYDDIKDKLMAQGVPEKEIAFIHDYDTPEQKQKLFNQMNAGDVRILLGSTSKCGAGMNAQKKMIALHHLDAPMRPSDVEHLIRNTEKRIEQAVIY